MPAEGSFGDRLAALRHEAGFSQRQLERLCGISYRMIAYYEGRDALPPGHVLSDLGEALGVSVDQLLGKEDRARMKRPKVSQRVLRRLQELEKLPLREKKALLAIIDMYLDKHRAEQRSA